VDANATHGTTRSRNKEDKGVEDDKSEDSDAAADAAGSESGSVRSESDNDDDEEDDSDGRSLWGALTKHSRIANGSSSSSSNDDKDSDSGESSEAVVDMNADDDDDDSSRFLPGLNVVFTLGEQSASDVDEHETEAADGAKQKN
jgi:hypothetical protein